MNDEQKQIEALVARAEAGDEQAGEVLLGMIEDLLVDGIGLPPPPQT